MDLAAIASAGIPVLCLDTCSLLDLMRDPTRETAIAGERQAGHDLVAAAEAGHLAILMADQVRTEFVSHDAEVEDEARRNLGRLREQVVRVHQLAAVYGATGSLDLSHLDDHVARARGLVDRWLAAAVQVLPSADAPGKAFARVNAARAPALRGKDSSKDCLVFETYLEVVAHLRAEGCSGKIVLISSNTRDYLTEGKVLKAEIATDLAPFSVDYAAKMQHARHLLGL